MRSFPSDESTSARAIARKDDGQPDDVANNDQENEDDPPNDFEEDDATWGREDDRRWDVFIADEDEYDPLPERGDFWDDDFVDDK